MSKVGVSNVGVSKVGVSNVGVPGVLHAWEGTFVQNSAYPVAVVVVVVMAIK